MATDLPITAILPGLRQALRTQRNVVLQAPPGAGKSTGVPPALLSEPWMAGKRLIMLEPRRLATRAVSARMAQMLGEPLGRTVGYRMRLDSQVSAATRIEVVTEGVLAALMQDDPALEGVACVIFDEFHERSLQADLGLALCLDVQANLNEDLRLLVMSATLAAEPVAQLLARAPIVRAHGRSHPVETRHVSPASGVARARMPGGDAETITRRTTAAVLRALSEEQGDILVFLPGAAEIRRVESDLRGSELEATTRVLPLMGELTQDEQDRALRPSAPGERKVVLATNIAETGLTIEGVRVVIDSGFARRARFDPVSGMSSLETLRISRASADQRRGRAGRTQPGVCYRLWSEGTDQSLETDTPAEILEADLAPLALELAGWNLPSPEALKWLDVPPAAAYAQARDLLSRLGALDRAGRVTAHGREMLTLRIHPRLAHMLLKGRALGLTAAACDLAALLGERDLLRRGEGGRDADVRTRLDILRGVQAAAQRPDRAALERTRRMAGQLRRQLGGTQRRHAAIDESGQAGVLIALAYPDRIARKRADGSGRYLLSNGKGARLEGAQSLARSELLAIAQLDGAEREARIFLAAPLSRAALEETFADEIVSRERVSWDSRERAVAAVQERLLGALLLEERKLARPAADLTARALLEGIRELGLEILPWERDARILQARARFAAALPREGSAGWPDLSDEALLARAEHWLLPRLEGMTRIAHLARLDLRAALEGELDFRLRRRLEELAPPHVVVPSRSRIRIDYLENDAPSLSAKVQELFGMGTTPRIGGGEVALLIKLLSPAGRPVQVTRDLASFWSGGYAQVRKELKGRYPRHDWPENPLSAKPSRGVRR